MNTPSIIALCIVGICFILACIYLFRHRGEGNCSSCSGCSLKTCPHRNKKGDRHGCNKKNDCAEGKNNQKKENE